MPQVEGGQNRIRRTSFVKGVHEVQFTIAFLFDSIRECGSEGS